MGTKFNMEKIAGLNRVGGVGAGLLNAASQAQQSLQKTTTFIPADEIIPNTKNKMSMDGIEELAQLIEMSGLEQPLVVRQRADGKYILLTGHRRFAAIQLLIKQEKWNENGLVEVKIKSLENMNLPLSNDAKEMLSILGTNQTRTKTDADIAFEITEWKKIIQELRNNGSQYLYDYFDEDGTHIQSVPLQGVKTRNIIAEQLNLSTGTVSKYEKVENSGTDELKNALKTNKININNAAAVASMTKREQDAFFKTMQEEKGTDEQITSDDVTVAQKAYKDQKKRKTSTADKPDDVSFITSNRFKKDIQSVTRSLNITPVKLTESQYADYCRYISGLEKLFKVK